MMRPIAQRAMKAQDSTSGKLLVASVVSQASGIWHAACILMLGCKMGMDRKLQLEAEKKIRV